MGNFSAFDRDRRPMLGEVVDEIIYGDFLFTQFTVAIVAIAGLAYADSGSPISITAWKPCSKANRQSSSATGASTRRHAQRTH